jgi:hypothetical protein
MVGSWKKIAEVTAMFDANTLIRPMQALRDVTLATSIIIGTHGLAIAPAWAGGSVTFAVQVESISDQNTLVLPDGSTTSAPISPGAMAVARQKNVLFRSGSLALNTGLQQLAEDGNPVPLIERVAETGVDVQFIIPNLHYRVTALPGDRLHFAVMFVKSNDLFYAFDDGGLPFFDYRGQPISGDVTQYVKFWDAGTEVNQPPGAGSYQAPSQPEPGAGEKEYEPVEQVRKVGDGFTYPPIAKVIRVTVTPVTP